MEWTAIGPQVLLLVCLGVGLLAIPFGLPGTWIIVLASLVYGWSTSFAQISVGVLAVLVALALAAELADLAGGIWGAKRFGGSRGAMLGALGGGLAGGLLLAPLFFGLGSIFGALAGAFVGAFAVSLVERRRLGPAARIGFGALVGRAISTAYKGISAAVMVGIDLWALWGRG